jgi:antigen 43
MRSLRWIIGGVGVVVGLATCVSAAEAACTITGVQSVTGAIANLGRYSALSAPVAQPMTINMVLAISSSGGTCAGSVAFLSAMAPAQMAGAGAARLNYNVQTLSGTNVLYTSTPGAAIAISAASSGGQATILVSVSAQAIAVASQSVAAGGYSDASVRVSVFDQSNTTAAVPGASSWFVNAAVNPSCTIGGQASAVDSSAVQVPVSSGGTVTTSPIQRSYASVLCNAPSTIALVSQNGGITKTGGAPGGFTNVIPYLAQASFGGATATLNTATAAMTTGAVSATTGASGTMTVQVTPQQPALPLISGRYDDVLTVTLTPQ